MALGRIGISFPTMSSVLTVDVLIKSDCDAFSKSALKSPH